MRRTAQKFPRGGCCLLLLCTCADNRPIVPNFNCCWRSTGAYSYRCAQSVPSVCVDERESCAQRYLSNSLSRYAAYARMVTVFQSSPHTPTLNLPPFCIHFLFFFPLCASIAQPKMRSPTSCRLRSLVCRGYTLLLGPAQLLLRVCGSWNTRSSPFCRSSCFQEWSTAPLFVRVRRAEKEQASVPGQGNTSSLLRALSLSRAALFHPAHVLDLAAAVASRSLHTAQRR